MLIQAAEALQRSSDDAHHVIVHLGDGTPTSGELAADKLARLVREPLADARVLAVALGARSDLTTLGAVVELTGGDLVQADARDDLRELVRELRLRAEVPVARDVELELPPGMSAVHRHGVAGLRSGDSLVLTGKLDHPVAGEIRVRAHNGSGIVEEGFQVQLAAQPTSRGVQQHLPRTWAQTEIAHLTRTEGFDARDRIIALSQRHTVLSRHTALLVLENDAMYREFNVVRRAKNTDTWSGELEKKEAESEDATERSEARTTSSVTDDAETDKARARREPPAGASPKPNAPASEPAPPSSTTRSGPSFEPDPFPGRLHDAPAGGLPAEPEPELDLDGLLGAEDTPTDGVGGRSGSGMDRGKGGFAQPPPPAPSKKAKTAQRPPRDDAPKPSSKPAWGAGTGTVGGIASKPRPIRRLTIRRTSEASSRALAQIARLRAKVQADPAKRSAHGQLVRAAIRVGHPDALVFARDWAEVDPDHAGALLALADVLARQGDPLGLRAYASAVEINPFTSSRHETLARAFASKGDLRRACSHRRAIVSIDPSKSEHHAMLAACLHHAGRITDAQAVLRDGERRAIDNARALRRTAEAIDQGALAEVALHRGAELRATLTWSGEDDLDIALVDNRGRRLSAMRPENIRVREDAGREELTSRRVRGTVFVEISRVGSDASRRLEPVTAELELATPHGRRVVPVVIETGSTRVAQVSWQTRWR
jgi:hypothetical protein